MSDGLVFALTLIAALGSGLMAGVFFAFSSFVMTALARLAPAPGIAAMQSINVVVINPLFMAGFLGVLPALTSAPAQKARPIPLRASALTASSSEARLMASRSVPSIEPLSAFIRSGRLSSPA